MRTIKVDRIAALAALIVSIGAAPSALAQQQQQGGSGDSGGSIFYSSTSLDIQSTQLQVVSSQTGLAAYGGTAGGTSDVTGPDATSNTLDVSA